MKVAASTLCFVFIAGSAPAQIVKMIGANTHLLILMKDGTLLGFGSDGNGQLDGIKSKGWDLPRAIKGLPAPVADIACGEEYSLVALRDGTVWAWGNDRYDGVGDGGSEHRVINGKYQIPGITNAKSVAAGGPMSFAILQNGGVVAWGESTKGKVRKVEFPFMPKQLVANGMSGFALTPDGYVYELSFRPSTYILLEEKINWKGRRVPGLVGIKAIKGSRTDAWAARLPSGKWMIYPKNEPSLPAGRDVSFGDATLFLTASGKAMTWGWNGFHAVGAGPVDVRHPQPVAGVSGAVAAASMANTSAVLLQNGKLVIWGVYSWLNGGKTSPKLRVIPMPQS